MMTKLGPRLDFCYCQTSRYCVENNSPSTSSILPARTTYTTPKFSYIIVASYESIKLLIYKVILKPIWTYGIQLWGTTSHSNIEILESFQSKVLRLIVDGPACQIPATCINSISSL
jgi:hypothetical protein